MHQAQHVRGLPRQEIRPRGAWEIERREFPSQDVSCNDVGRIPLLKMDFDTAERAYLDLMEEIEAIEDMR